MGERGPSAENSTPASQPPTHPPGTHPVLQGDPSEWGPFQGLQVSKDLNLEGQERPHSLKRRNAFDPRPGLATRSPSSQDP